MGLRASSEAALDCLGIHGSDVVAVVFNDEQRAIAEALAEAANRRARAVTCGEVVDSPGDDRRVVRIGSLPGNPGRVSGTALMEIPDPRYVKTDDGAYIAYQVVGDGPVDIAWQFDFIGNIDVTSEALRRG